MALTSTDPEEREVPGAARLSFLDRGLPLWILAAMALGLGLGALLPGLDDRLEAVEVGGVSLPIAVGLLAMMYPVLAKVRYGRLDAVTADRRMLGASLFLNWVVGPALMFALAWLLLPDLPDYRTGLIIVGLARCIAMVLIWNDLACGDREAAVVLVAINSAFQVVAYSLLGWLYLDLLPRWLGLGQGEALDVGLWDITGAVVVFLGVPLAAGFLSRVILERRRGRDWYEERFLPRIGPIALYGLLFTIVVLFALQGDAITDAPLDVVRIAIPLLAYFALMWGGSFALGLRLGLPYDRNATVAFTAAGNNFELAIAVSVSVFGLASGQALAGAVGPLIEVPVLVGLVYVALWARGRFYPAAGRPGARRGEADVSSLPGPGDGRPGVLFLCVHNAGRSQMALGWFTRLAGDRAVAWSGGSEPARSSTRWRSPPWPRWASTSRARSPAGGPRRWCGPSTSWSRWVVGTPARSSPAPVARTGPSTTPPVRTWPRSDAVRDEVRAHVEALLADLGITPRPSPPQGDASAG